MKELKRLLSFVKPYWKSFAAGIFCLIVVDFLQLLVPLLLKGILDHLVSFVDATSTVGLTLATSTTGSTLVASGTFPPVMNEISLYAISILVVAVFMFVFRVLWRRFIIISSRKIERDLRHAYFHKLLTLSTKWFDTAKTGDLMARATSDVMAVQRLAGVAVFSTIDATVLFILSLYSMYLIDPQLTMVVAIPLPLMSILVKAVGPKIHKKADAAQAAFGSLSTNVQEVFSGIRVIKDFGQEKSQEESFAKISDDYLNKNLTLALFSNATRPVMHLLIELSFAIAIFYGGWKVVTNSLSFGSLVAFIAYLDILIWPVIAIGWVMNLFLRGLASMARIGKILDSEDELKDGHLNYENDSINNGNSSTKSNVASDWAMEFKNLTFSYTDKSQPVLKDINLKIPWGSTLGVIGRTGSGKSTLLRLLVREYETCDGTIFVNGHSIQDYKQEALRNFFSIVPQDSLLFTGTIKDNILFGIDKTKHDDCNDSMKKAASLAGLSSEISTVFTEGFDTVIGEKGVSLSGGQRQRMAIARALVLQRPIIIFDDCLSAVDTKTEEEILVGVKDVVEHATSIIVSNRLSSLRYADTIVVFEDGSITERGTHEELLKNDGLYKELYLRQQIERSLEGASLK